MGIVVCPSCKRNIWNWVDECRCGYNLKDSLIKIKRSVEVEETIDTIITWSRKSTKKQIEEGAGERTNYYHNLSTGEQSTELCEVMTDRGFRLLERKGNYKKGIFVGEDTEKGYLVFILCSLDISLPNEGDIRHWEELCRMYLSKNKELYYEPITWKKDGSVWKEKVLFKNKFFKTNFKLLNVSFDITKQMYINEVDDNSWQDFCERIKSFIPATKIVKLSGNKMLHVNDAVSFAEYLKVKISNNVRSGPKQQKIDELTAIKLGTVEKPENFVSAITDGSRYNKIGTNVDTFATLEAVPGLEKTCVLRTFSSIADDDKNIQEGYRMYVQGKEIYICKENLEGKYVYTPMFKNPSNWNFALNDFDVSVTKDTLLEYFGSVINDIDVNARSKAIWAFCKWPIFEQLSKAGYTNITNWILNNSVMINPEELLMKMFNSDLKGKNLYNKLGVSKFQLDYVENNINCFRSLRSEHYDKGYFSVISFVKMIMDDENNTNYYSNRYWHRNSPDTDLASVANLDDETFKSYADAYVACLDKLGLPKYVDNEISYIAYNRENYRYEDIHNYNIENAFAKMSFAMICLALIKNTYSPISAIHMLPSIIGIIDQRIEEVNRHWNGTVYKSYHEPLMFYRDYLVMVSQVGDTKNLRAKFRDIEQIKDMHDSLAAIIQINKDKIVLENFRKRAKDCKKWEYEEDDFVVIAPKEPCELAKEGNELHHCVKSYIDRVSNGYTNIMFIRKAEELDVPFFTVEVSNDGTIEQIHGLCNRNLDTEPVLEPFVKRWVKSRKLKTNGFNKVR